MKLKWQVHTLSGAEFAAEQSALVEDQTVCMGAGALRDLGRSFHHLHDQHLWCGAVPPHRLPRGESPKTFFFSPFVFHSRHGLR